jgi:omega-amidase
MLHVAILQNNLLWQSKEENLNMLEQRIAAVEVKSQVIILPEMFSTGFTMDVENFAESMDGPTVCWIKKNAIQYKKIIAGSIIIKEEEKFYNRFIWMLPNGNLHFYDKRHLFGMAGEDKVFSAGTNKLVVQANGYKIGVQICYDLRFPVWNRQSAKAQMVDAIIYVANWPTKRIAHWDCLLQARAIENQCYVLACNRVGIDGNNLEYCGHSQVINPAGELVQKIINTQEILYTTLDKNVIEQTRLQLPFLQDADEFMIL